MSILVIKGSGSFPSIPITDFYGQSNPDLSQSSYMAVEYVPGTSAEPNELWNGQGAYFRQKGVSSNIYNNAWHCMSGTAQITPDPTIELLSGLSGNKYHAGQTKLFIYAVRTGTTEQNDTLNVYWDIADDFSDVGFATREYQMMYANTWANAQNQPGFIAEEREWDDSPSADAGNPNNMNPEGGEYAETDPFGYGNEDMEIPSTVLELDYSSFITAYTCDDAAIGNIGSAIFSDNTWQSLKMKFDGVGNPIDYIISAVEIPYSPGGTGKNFNLGGVDIETAGGNKIPVSVMANRYYQLNFGAITLKETWGTEKDYSTTDVAIYLPYVGVKDLDASILVNSTITVKAWLDAWTGDLLYLLQVSNKSRAYKYLASSGIVYHFQGNCGKQVPIGRADNSAQTLALFGALGSMGVGLATGNVGAALGGAAGLIGAGAMSPKVSMAGGISGAIGRGDQQDAWLIIKQSVPVYPKDWRAHFGAPRYQTFTLGDLSGYVKCADVHADSIEGANDAERAAIEQALKSGVFMS